MQHINITTEEKEAGLGIYFLTSAVETDDIFWPEQAFLDNGQVYKL